MGKRIPAFTLLLGLLLGIPASACLNYYGKTNVHGESAPEGDHYTTYIGRLRNQHQHELIVTGPPPKEPAVDADFRVRSDYAVVLIRRGESPKAVEILEAVEKEKPGEYIVAANLGTAYELSGDLEKAHHWISEGMRRNPKGHEGTEWLHLKILEARTALAKDPDWAKSHEVLDLDFGADPVPRKPAAWPKDSGDAEGVIKALTYQLGERLAFVKPPDALVAGMIATLADLLAIYRSVDHAIPVYELALSYKPARAELTQTRLASSMAVRKEEARQYHSRGVGVYSETWVWSVIGIAAVVSVLAILYWIRKGGLIQ